MTRLLEIDRLGVSIGPTRVLHGVSVALDRGETLALVGESGSGKTMTALSVMRLLPRGATTEGAIRFDGRDLSRLDEREMCAVRGAQIGFVFQEPMTALNPVHTIGRQIAEPLVWHRRAGRAAVAARVAELLDDTGLTAAGVTPERFPHQLSGGQRQRVVIAIAMALRPRLVIADEPTSALDVTVQAQILELLARLRARDGLGLMLITHDLAVAASMADRIAVMRAGEVLEEGAPAAIFGAPRHDYTRRLIAAARLGEAAGGAALRPAPPPLIAAENVVAEFRGGSLFAPARHARRALDGVSLAVHAGESVGLVGESGSGKTTLARILLGLVPPTAGRVAFNGSALSTAGGDLRPRELYRHVQAVFQDPYGSFDPRHRVERIVAEPLHLEPARPSRPERHARVAAALEAVGLEADAMARYPHAFSGGQRQRIAIARAIVVEPSLIVADEPVSALDVSIQAQILALFARLRRERGMAYLFISHDLAVVRAVTDRVVVLKDGRIVEEGPTAAVFDAPSHPYTRALVDASPDLDRVLEHRSRAAE